MRDDNLHSSLAARAAARQRQQARMRSVWRVVFLTVVALLLGISVWATFGDTLAGERIANFVTGATPTPAATLEPYLAWMLSDPVLPPVADQEFVGRFALEIWAEGEYFYFSGGPDGKLGYLYMIANALRNPRTALVVPSPWPEDAPVVRDSGEYGPYMGRVIAEVWENKVVLAISGPMPADMLAEVARLYVERMIVTEGEGA